MGRKQYAEVFRVEVDCQVPVGASDGYDAASRSGISNERLSDLIKAYGPRFRTVQAKRVDQEAHGKPRTELKGSRRSATH